MASNLCQPGIMAQCGAYDNDDFKKCEFWKQSKALRPCSWNPFYEICTNLKAQMDRDGVAMPK